MSEPLTVSVWAFAEDFGAQRAVHPLAVHASTTLRLADACVISWPTGRPRPVAWQERDLTGDRRLSGAFWGLLISCLFLLPPTTPPARAGTTGAIPESVVAADPAGTASAHWSALGLPDLGLSADFAASVQAAVAPGSSALILFDASPDRHALEKLMPVTARQVSHRRLTAEHQTRLHAAFDD